VLEVIDIVIDSISMIFMGYIAIRIYSRQPLTSKAVIEPPSKTNVDIAMGELLEKSRKAGGRLHIHEVEEVVRRRLR
jgi:hypothetical protein